MTSLGHLTKNFAGGLLRIVVSVSMTNFPTARAEDAIPLVSYLERCDGYLTAVEQGRVENFFLASAGADSQKIMRLLVDYGAVFSRRYNEAVMVALNSRGISPPKSRKELYRFIRSIREFLKSSDDKFDQLNSAVLELMTTRAAAADQGEIVSRVEHLKIRNLSHAIQSSPNRDQVMRVLEAAVRFTLLASIREAVERYAELDKNSLISDERSARAVGILGMVAGPIGGFRLNYSLYDFLLNHNFDLGIWFYLTGAILTFGGLIAGTFAGTFVGLLVKSRMFGTELGGPYSKGDENVVRTVRRLEGEAEFSVNGLLDSYAEITDRIVLRLDKACEKPICELSPVDVAYLGHIEIQEVKALTQSAAILLGGLSIADRLSKLKSTAQKVLQSPDDLEQRFYLMREIEIFERDFSYDSNRSKSSAAVLAKEVAKVRAWIEKISHKPFAQSTLNLPLEDVNKYEMILIKLRSDLKQLSTLELEQTTAFARLKLLAPAIVKMIEAKPKGMAAPEWERYAELVVLSVEEMESVSARVH